MYVCQKILPRYLQGILGPGPRVLQLVLAYRPFESFLGKYLHLQISWDRPRTKPLPAFLGHTPSGGERKGTSGDWHPKSRLLNRIHHWFRPKNQKQHPTKTTSLLQKSKMRRATSIKQNNLIRKHQWVHLF